MEAHRGASNHAKGDPSCVSDSSNPHEFQSVTVVTKSEHLLLEIRSLGADNSQAALRVWKRGTLTTPSTSGDWFENFCVIEKYFRVLTLPRTLHTTSRKKKDMLFTSGIAALQSTPKEADLLRSGQAGMYSRVVFQFQGNKTD